MIPIEIFLVMLFVIAFLYSSVGHADASGYLAIVGMTVISPALMKTSTLILYIFVAGIVIMPFIQTGYFRLMAFRFHKNKAVKLIAGISILFNRESLQRKFYERIEKMKILLNYIFRDIVFCFMSVLGLDWICGVKQLTPQFLLNLQ